MVLDDFREAALAVQDALGGPQDVVAVRQQASQVGGGVGRDVEDVPDVGDDGQGGPLQGEAEGGGVGGDGDVQGAGSLALCRKRRGNLLVLLLCLWLVGCPCCLVVWFDRMGGTGVWKREVLCCCCLFLYLCAP